MAPADSSAERSSSFVTPSCFAQIERSRACPNCRRVSSGLALRLGSSGIGSKRAALRRPLLDYFVLLGELPEPAAPELLPVLLAPALPVLLPPELCSLKHFSFSAPTMLSQRLLPTLVDEPLLPEPMLVPLDAPVPALPEELVPAVEGLLVVEGLVLDVPALDAP